MLYLVALLVAPFFPHFTWADQIAISDLPLFSRATDYVQLCIQSQQSSYIKTYGCTVTDPAACLCSDASSSYRVASAISDCVNVDLMWTDGRSQYTTATEIFASYCLTNAGISARDETLLQDFPIYSRGPWQVAYCATSVSSAHSRSLGCDFNTPAVCLCGISQSSFVIQSVMLSCASQELYNSLSEVSTVAELWSSYCAANLATSATRQLEAVITQSGSASTGAVLSAVPSATASTPTNTATGTRSESSSSSTGTRSESSSSSPGTSPTAISSSSSSSGSGLSVGAQVGLAVGCAIGAALLTIVATWWKPRQLGRFLTCGTWPAKKVDNQAARAQITHAFTRPWRPAPHAHE